MISLGPTIYLKERRLYQCSRVGFLVFLSLVYILLCISLLIEAGAEVFEDLSYFMDEKSDNVSGVLYPLHRYESNFVQLLAFINLVI